MENLSPSSPCCFPRPSRHHRQWDMGSLTYQTNDSSPCWSLRPHIKADAANKKLLVES